jgi:hypothetical protein
MKEVYDISSVYLIAVPATEKGSAQALRREDCRF